MKLKTLILENAGISITIGGGMVEYLETIVKQAKRSDVEINENVDIKEIVTMIEARKIYSDLFGFQFKEEKVWIPKLLKMFKAIS